MSWLPLSGADGFFISDQGKFKSPTGRILSEFTINGSTRAVKVRKKTVQVHLAVLTTFVGPRPPGGVPWWSNGDPTDNRLVNLKWHVPNSDEAEVLVRVNRCRNGHVYSRENTKHWGTGHRICLDCEKGHPPVTQLPEVL
ncbi:hypothetical protein [Mycolicibacterium sphagni]|uniref:HNH endonuclease n=1 Tax=Mycolicibacterium sphagni TaxID=1786 RepID=A0A255DXD1_9MYCO|nr:hypothetical protein [Mycolicibacterium sphagni]OYN81742.1 hypothetical protein CG716_05145 [Mycolicibacterium sphagni]